MFEHSPKNLAGEERATIKSPPPLPPFVSAVICLSFRDVAPTPLVPTALRQVATKVHPASQPRLHRVTGSDVNPSVGYHPKKIPHY